MSLWFLRLSSFVVFGVSFFVAIATFKNVAGFSYTKPIGLFIVYLLFPLICAAVYIVSQFVLVLRTLDDRWVRPLSYPLPLNHCSAPLTCERTADVLSHFTGAGHRRPPIWCRLLHDRLRPPLRVQRDDLRLGPALHRRSLLFRPLHAPQRHDGLQVGLPSAPF
jgi:hypothetical protein